MGIFVPYLLPWAIWTLGMLAFIASFKWAFEWQGYMLAWAALTCFVAGFVVLAN